VLARLRGGALADPPGTTALGALLRHVTGAAHPPGHDYQPSNVIYALFEPMLGRIKKHDKKVKMAARARVALAEWGAQTGIAVGPVPERVIRPPEPAQTTPPAAAPLAAPAVEGTAAGPTCAAES
jgi:methylenetetrahydrofolate--tRNA-(uracil-5-)-methyltransferase